MFFYSLIDQSLLHIKLQTMDPSYKTELERLSRVKKLYCYSIFGKCKVTITLCN